jgi:hypothetical protein
MGIFCRRLPSQVLQACVIAFRIGDFLSCRESRQMRSPTSTPTTRLFDSVPPQLMFLKV